LWTLLIAGYSENCADKIFDFRQYNFTKRITTSELATLQLKRTFIYIIHSAKISKFYVGITYNIERRLKQHNSGESTFTRAGTPWKLIWLTQKENRNLTEILEQKLKNLSVSRKLKFMQKYKEGIVENEYFNSLLGSQQT